MTKKELLPLAKLYFDHNPERIEIFGTEDKHFFNNEGDAKAYCRDLKQYYHFTPVDFDEKIQERKEKEEKAKKEAIEKEKQEFEEEIKIADEIKAEEKAKKQQKKAK